MTFGTDEKDDNAEEPSFIINTYSFKCEIRYAFICIYGTELNFNQLSEAIKKAMNLFKVLQT